jgi:hypothetical protein
MSQVILQVVLNLPKSDKALLPHAKVVYEHFLNNSALPNPSPMLSVFLDDLTAYEVAQTKAASRAKGAAQVRNAARRKVRANLRQLRDYVQAVIDALPPGLDPAVVAESAFMSLKRIARRNKARLAASHGASSGTAQLEARAVGSSATYYWEYSLDQVSWTSAPETMQASTVVVGLTPGKVYYFRFRTLTRKGKGDYSQVVSLMVV